MDDVDGVTEGEESRSSHELEKGVVWEEEKALGEEERSETRGLNARSVLFRSLSPSLPSRPPIQAAASWFGLAAQNRARAKLSYSLTRHRERPLFVLKWGKGALPSPES